MKSFLKYLVFSILLMPLCALAQTDFNLQLRSQYKFSDTVTLANIGGYARNNNEYALVGTSIGLTIFDVTNPDNVKRLFDIPGNHSTWREVKTYGNYAYVTTEGYLPGQKTNGLQIINLSYLPDSAPYKYYDGNGKILHKLVASHTLHLDNGYAYLYGSTLINDTSYQNSGVIILYLTNPWFPTFAGGYDKGPYALGYVHDGYARHDTIWSCHIFGGFFTAIDCHDRQHPVEIAKMYTPKGATHNSWLSDNGKTLFVTDETDSSFLCSYDVSDLSNIRLLDSYKSKPTASSSVHNTHILNDFAVTSWYTEGVVVVDGHRPQNLVKVGSYDTSPLTGGGYHGCWGVYPFLPSGNLLASDIQEGLFVLSPTYVRASYLEGMVVDSTTKAPIFEAGVEIFNDSIIKTTDLSGNYKTGIGKQGKRDVLYSKPGYKSLMLKSVDFKSAKVINRNVALLKGSGTDTLIYKSDSSQLGIKAFSHYNSLRVSPNPFTHKLQVFWNIDFSAKHINIYDLYGKLINHYLVNTGATSLELNDAGLAAGVYLMRVEGNGGVMNARIVKKPE